MMISEFPCCIAKDGSLTIPSQILTEMGLKSGETVQIAYFTKDGTENSYQEFLLTDNGFTEPDGLHIAIPNCLLRQANIQRGADIQVICCPGAIVISTEDPLTTDELNQILDSLNIAENTLSELTSRGQPALLDIFEEGTYEN